MANPAVVTAIANAITRQENTANTYPTYNNPGAIMDTAYYAATKQFRLQSYNTPEEGRAALEKLVSYYIDHGFSIESMIAKYAPSGHGGNDPATYANNVSTWTNIPLGVPLNTVDTGNVSPTGVDTNILLADLTTTTTTDLNSGSGDVATASIGDSSILPLVLIGGIGLVILAEVFSS